MEASGPANLSTEKQSGVNRTQVTAAAKYFFFSFSVLLRMRSGRLAQKGLGGQYQLYKYQLMPQFEAAELPEHQDQQLAPQQNHQSGRFIQ